MNRSLIITLLIATAFSPVGTAASAKWQEIQQNLDAGNVVKATELVQAQIKDDPNDARAQLTYATLLLKENKTDEALNILEQHRDQLSTLPEYYNNLAYALFYKGDKEKAIDTLKQGIAQNSDFNTLYNNISTIYSFMASKAYAVAIDQGGKSAPAQPKLSMLFPKAKDVDKTIAVAPVTGPVNVNQVAAATPDLWREQVRKTVDDWAQVWAQQNAKAYLEHYSDDFRTPQGYSLTSWRNLRRERVSSPKYIKVKLSDFDIRLAGDGSLAIAYFVQEYRSNTVNDKVDKLLVLKRNNQQWKIISEDVDK